MGVALRDHPFELPRACAAQPFSCTIDSVVGELGCTRLLHTYRPASSRAALDDNRMRRVWCTRRKLAHHPLAIITPPNLISHTQGNIIPSAISDQPACHFSSHACQFAFLSAHACQLSIAVCGCMSACHSQTLLPGRPRPSQWAPALLSGSQRMTT